MTDFGAPNRGTAARDSSPSYTQRSTSVPGVTGNWNTGGRAVYTGSFARGYSPIGNGDTNRVGMPTNSQPRTAIPIPRPKPMVAQVPVAVNPPRAFPARPVQRSLSTYIRSPYSNQPRWSPKNLIRSIAPRQTGSTHFKTSGPESGRFIHSNPSVDYRNDRAGTTGGGQGGGGGGGWRKGGNVDKPSILKRILARNKTKEAIKVTQSVTPKKTPWKKGAKPAFAKGGAVEAFMKKYPSFKLA